MLSYLDLLKGVSSQIQIYFWLAVTAHVESNFLYDIILYSTAVHYNAILSQLVLFPILLNVMLIVNTSIEPVSTFKYNNIMSGFNESLFFLQTTISNWNENTRDCDRSLLCSYYLPLFMLRCIQGTVHVTWSKTALQILFLSLHKNAS